MQPTILLADDHSIIRKGLKLYIQLNLGYTDIQEVGACNALMRELVKNLPFAVLIPNPGKKAQRQMI